MNILCGAVLLPAAPPLATNDTFIQSPSGSTIVPGPGVLGNDSVPCPGQATVRVVTPPAFGSVTLNNTCGFKYTPTGARDDSFTYEIVCPSGLVRVKPFPTLSELQQSACMYACPRL